MISDVLLDLAGVIYEGEKARPVDAVDRLLGPAIWRPFDTWDCRRAAPPSPLHVDVCFWHLADMLNALTNVRFGGKADVDQPLLTNLDL